jgi:hypothetical protein
MKGGVNKMKLIDKIRTGVVSLALIGAISGGIGGGIFYNATGEEFAIKNGSKSEECINSIYLEELDSQKRAAEPFFVYGAVTALVAGLAVDILDKKRKDYN